jgi:hypothetical protein
VYRNIILLNIFTVELFTLNKKIYENWGKEICLLLKNVNKCVNRHCCVKMRIELKCFIPETVHSLYTSMIICIPRISGMILSKMSGLFIFFLTDAEQKYVLPGST